MSPPLGVAFGLFQDLDGIATDLSSGNLAHSLTDVGNLPFDLIGEVVHGYVEAAGELAATACHGAGRVDGTAELLSGLLSL